MTVIPNMTVLFQILISVLFGLKLITVDILYIMGESLLVFEKIDVIGLLLERDLVHIRFLLLFSLPLLFVALLVLLHQFIVAMSNNYKL